LRFVVVLALLAAVGSLVCSAAQAQSGSSGSSTSTGFCDRSKPTTASEQDRLFRFAVAIRNELDASGADTAIISRSGLNLARFHIRYSHAAVLTRSESNVWTARQLYYACDEARPRLFDQGLAGFTAGVDDPDLGYISLVVMPAQPGHMLRVASQDKSLALALLASTYSADAYAFSTRYQNCNQWVIEMIGLAWGNLPGGDDVRDRAQDWLKQAHYDPSPVDVGSGLLMIASAFTPMLHLNDHPKADRESMRLKVSLPLAIETFVKEQWATSQRIELCHTRTQIVIHHGWSPITEGCVPGAGDRVLALD